MIYAKVLNQQVVQYPYGFMELQAENPYTNYGPNFDVAYWFPQTEEASKGFQLVAVELSAQPAYNPITQGVREIDPQLKDGKWLQTWEVYSLDATQIQINELEIKSINKNRAMELLSLTDWVELGDVSDPNNPPYLVNKAEFTAYRTALRIIAINPQIEVEWPVRPEEVWSTTQ